MAAEHCWPLVNAHSEISFPALHPSLSRFALLAFAAIAAAQAETTPTPESSPFTAKELAQGYREHAILAKPLSRTRATVDADEARDGLHLNQKFSRFGDLRVLDLADADSADRALARLQATGRYEFVERDLIRHADVVPNDSQFTTQWQYQNTGQSGGRVGADISATTAWDTLHDAPNVIVAIIDSGALLTHADLFSNFWFNPSPTFSDVNGARATTGRGTLTGPPTDDNGHGTHVAGIIGAIGNNGLTGAGVTGVAWKVQLMILKFLNNTGTGALSDEVACFNYAIQHGAQIINGSFGESGGSQLSSSEQAVVAAARDAGIIFVAAAGNDAANMDVSPHYPASLPLDNIVAVGSSTRLEDRSMFSNYGSGSVELFAPGEQILSTYYTDPTSSATLSGTSMAAPMVSGALALMKQKFPGDTYRQLINRLLRSTDARPAYANYCQTGGRLNLAAALTSTDNRPFNDDFATRGHLVGTSVTTRSNNTGATAELPLGEHANAGFAPSATLWWEWTAPTTATVNLDTSGSSYDTVLAVYTGTALGSLTSVAANDNDGPLLTSRVSFSAQAGTTYEIVVDGKAGATGFTKLNLSAVPSNDNFSGAQLLSGMSALVTATNAGATREPGEPQILHNPGGRSLWYKWTAPVTQRFQVAAYSDDLDPLLAVYTGSAVNALTPIAASDNAYNEANPGTTVTTETSALCTFTATAGTTYYFTVDAKPPSGGSAVLLGTFRLSLTDSLWQGLTTAAVTSAPAVAPDGTVYVGSTDSIFYAFNPDGSKKWASNIISGIFDTAAAAIADDGTIIIGGTAGPSGTDAKVFAFNPDGTTKWTFPVPAPTGGTAANSISNAPAIAADGTIYIKGDDGYLYALNPGDGSQKWRFNTNGASYGSTTIAPDGTIYVPSGDNYLYALNPADGSQKWRFQGNNQIYTAPALDAAGNLYFGSLGTSSGPTTTGTFYSITPAGTQRWTPYSTGGAITSSPALSPDGSTVYFGSYDMKLHAVNTATGTVRWTYPLADQVRASSPAVDATGVIYIGCYDYKLYAVNPDGTLKRTYPTGNWVRSSPVISGTRLYVGSNDHKLYAYDIGTGPANGPWPQFHHNARRLGRAIVVTAAPVIVAASQSVTVALGSTLALNVTASGTAPVTYQWSENGTPIAGATAATYTVASATAATAGSYTVAVTGAGGTVTSAPAVITTTTVTTASNPGRLINLSILTPLAPGERMTMGTVLGGAGTSGTKPLLVRAAGPSLAQFNVTGFLPDPTMTLNYTTPTPVVVVAANNDWGGTAALSAAFASVGAFPYASANSKDAALFLSGATALVPGKYTVQVSDASGGSGTVIAELYDATPAASFIASTPRLINVSVLKQINAGATLTAGFVIGGSTARTVLIRAIGPGLAQFDVSGVMPDPQLTLNNTSVSPAVVVAANDNWGGDAAIAQTATNAGAFTVSDGTSKDAMLLITLAPGNYTAQVSPVNGTAGGTAIVEVYEVP